MTIWTTRDWQSTIPYNIYDRIMIEKSFQTFKTCKRFKWKSTDSGSLSNDKRTFSVHCIWTSKSTILQNWFFSVLSSNSLLGNKFKICNNDREPIYGFILILLFHGVNLISDRIFGLVVEVWCLLITMTVL